MIEDLIQSKGRVESLMDVMVRPSPDPKRVLGTVEIHENGLRYRSNKGSRIGALRTHTLYTHAAGATRSELTGEAVRGLGGARAQTCRTATSATSSTSRARPRRSSPSCTST